MNCPFCGCRACPSEIRCSRKVQKGTDFFPCPACNCLGAWQFKRKGYIASIQEKEEMRTMDVGTLVANATTRNEILPSKVVGKSCSARLLEARALKTPKFNGLVYTVKVKGVKYAHFVRFDGLDLAFTAQQLKTTETDDWIGKDIKFVTKDGTDAKGKSKKFVNVFAPKMAKKKAKR